jgi:tRNA A37 methylthiotransferase MiaB
MLERAGARVALLDCLAREFCGGMDRPFGTGKFPSERIPKPPALRWVPRHYRRYGLPGEAFEARLAALAPPDFILVTCTLTYWHGGAFHAARLLRAAFPGARILLGGVYAALCPEHASASGLFDAVVADKDPDDVAARLAALTGLPVRADDALEPAWHLYGTPLRHAAVLTGRGCPLRCTYCATPFLHGTLRRRPPETVAGELARTVAVTGARDIAFYDDALLVGKEHHFLPLLEEILRRGIRARFHLPNAIHPRLLDAETCRLMKAADFRTVRLAYEGMGESMRERSTHKVDRDAVAQGIRLLREAGFTAAEVGAYILHGLPGLAPAEIRADLEFAHSLGAQLFLTSYSPIPRTPDFERAAAAWPALRDEPLLHNNTLTMIRDWPEYVRLKAYSVELNRRLERR